MKRIFIGFWILMGTATFIATAYYCYRIKFPKQRQLAYDRFDNAQVREQIRHEILSNNACKSDRISTISSLSEMTSSSKNTANRLEKMLLMDSYCIEEGVYGESNFE